MGRHKHNHKQEEGCSDNLNNNFKEVCSEVQVLHLLRVGVCLDNSLKLVCNHKLGEVCLDSLKLKLKEVYIFCF